ncbi:hypothetical protein GF389_01200, partial [Candidatus Dojkabacteria bacterium]|nr:hypothetical protein [Candidatus Dojkabacteria bacterium]
MINIKLIEKILETKHQEKEIITTQIEKIGDKVSDIFAKKLIIYANEQIEKDEQFKSLAKRVETFDRINDTILEEIIDWMASHEELDFDEFWEEYE